VLYQFEVADDFGVEQAYGITRSGITKSGMKFLGDCRPTNHVAAFQHPHPPPFGSEVTGAHQTIVPTADDDDVLHGLNLQLASKPAWSQNLRACCSMC